MQNVPVGNDTTTPSSTGAEPAKEAQSAMVAGAAERAWKRLPACQGKFMAPLKDDPDEMRLINNAKRLSRTSPYAAHVQDAFARFAVFWNRALFPRIVKTAAGASDKRRKQISVAEQRLLAVCVMQHGRNHEVCPSTVQETSSALH